MAIEDNEIDHALCKNWKFVAKRVLEQMCKHPIKDLYVGREFGMRNTTFVGDSFNIFACNVAFSFGTYNAKYLTAKYISSERLTMIDVNRFDYDTSQFVMHDMFYMGCPIRLEKHRHGLPGASIVPHSLLDAINQVGLSAEELLIQCDIL